MEKTRYKILFPCEPYSINKIDEEYKIERNISTIANLDYYMYDHNVFVEEGKLVHNINMNDECILIYRGWMLKPEQYTDLNNRIIMKSGNKIQLINTPKEYETCHCFPNIYSILHDYTPLIRVLTKCENEEDFEDLLRDIPYDFFIKDFVKSEKTIDGVEKISKDITPKELKDKVLDFLEKRGKLFTGGIVLKEFVNLQKYFNVTNEWRAFCLDGEVISFVQNSGLNTNIKPPDVFVKAVCKIIRDKSKFFTVDFAELDYDMWTIIETGDGQVSSFPKNDFNILIFYNKINNKNENII